MYNDFAKASDDLLRNLIDKPELVDAWKRLSDCSASEAVRRNPGVLEALNAPKGSRPNPRTYLGEDYVNNHLKEFRDEGKCSRIVAKSDYETWGVGKPDVGKTEFVSKSSDVDILLKRCGNNKACLSEVLGIQEYVLSGGLVRIDFDLKKSANALEFPSGNEFGVNDQWLPGGKLPTGQKEAIIKTEGMNINVDYSVNDIKF